MKKVFALICLTTIVLVSISCRNASFKEVKIGSQTLMESNLSTEKFRNGDPIPEAKTEAEWRQASIEGKPAWCVYNNDLANEKKYGKLYNWYAVVDPRGLAPDGWHIPSDSEWTKLVEFLGGDDAAGVMLKSNTGWLENVESPDTTKKVMINGNGTNSSGFNALPGGERTEDGEFKDIGSDGSWWSSTDKGASILTQDGKSAWGRELGSSYNHFYKSFDQIKGRGKSVRCIKD
jgi:uncharacterized protein (TIGR02145 family)